MTDLSFLPRKERRPRPSIRWSRLAGIAAGVAVTAGAMWYGSVRAVSYLDMRAELATLSVEYEQLKPVQDLQNRVISAEKRLQEEEERLRPFRTATKIRDALEILNRSVPGGVVIESFNVTPARQFKITGQASSLTDVARFMVALEASEPFHSLQVRFPTPFAAGADKDPGPPAGTTAAPPGSVAGPIQPGAQSEPEWIRFELNGFIDTVAFRPSSSLTEGRTSLLPVPGGRFDWA